METTSLNSSAWALSRAKGFLAGLIYIDSTQTIIGQDSNANPMFFQNIGQWIILQQAHSQLEETRCRLVDATHSIGLPITCPDDTLNSFVNPTSFYETAVSGFHNTLLGLPPTALGDVVALCAMSHVTSCYLYSAYNNILFDPFSDFDLWRSTISDHEHRRLFDVLIKVACQEPYLTTLVDTYPVLQYGNGACNDALDLSWDPDLTTYTLNSFSTVQNEQSSHIVSESMQLTTAGTQAPDLQSLQGSPIVSNFAHFLERCGELPLILSGRGATVNEWHLIGTSKPDESRDEQRLKRLYIRLLQQRDPPNNIVIEGIVSVVKRFGDLGYLQSAGKIRDYLLLIGKGMLSNDQVFLNFVQLIQASMVEAENL
ncbi:hypothetical protein FLAG1_07803 [Fusarium langsethiae]|uniref:Uncharacterized protein n=1 Tax=Fusarium langsethiae TaxID=179993 RepID=A0A0M9ETT9_FUSLA|nr:hypothetical protein FLAG1_07803 [Fusarium langsethiae]GKU05055.1 unnamed protein product [Fusarium langsethiae]GKU21365.1 unnamed protein product [Fusarium langsethiae]